MALFLNLVSAVGVIFAILVTGYQIHLHRRELLFRSYLDAASRALDLSKMMMENKSLHALYEYTPKDIEKEYAELDTDEKALVNYCDLIIFLCETVWISHREGAMHRDEWPYWEKWINQLKGSPYFRWTVHWCEDDYDPQFIKDLGKKITQTSTK